VGGEARFRQFLQGLTINPETKVDLCCGSGQATQVLVHIPRTLLDWMPHPVLKRAQQNVPQAHYEAFAENMPFPDNQFDLVHTSAALHEMEPSQLADSQRSLPSTETSWGVYLVDFHAPSNWVFWPGLSLFFVLFETETAWQLLKRIWLGY